MEEKGLQALYIAFRCMCCEKVTCCVIDGTALYCDECIESHNGCKLLNDNYLFELQNFICTDCLNAKEQ